LGTTNIIPPELGEFVADKLIDGVFSESYTGKEATVHIVYKEKPDRDDLYAAKVYRDLDHRSFRRDGIYREGRVVLDERITRAIQTKTALGQAIAFKLWAGEEAAMLRRMYSEGVDVPELIASTGAALLMEYFGDEDGPAPLLQEVCLTRSEAEAAFAAVMGNVEVMLRADLVHGDLSAYNILYWDARPIIIDVPQAVDARLNKHARSLFYRDVKNVCDYFKRQGLKPDADHLADDLWVRYETARL